MLRSSSCLDRFASVEHPLRFYGVNGYTLAESDVQRPTADPIAVPNLDGWETARSNEIAKSLRMDFKNWRGFRNLKYRPILEKVANS